MPKTYTVENARVKAEINSVLRSLKIGRCKYQAVAIINGVRLSLAQWSTHDRGLVYQIDGKNSRARDLVSEGAKLATCNSFLVHKGFHEDLLQHNVQAIVLVGSNEVVQYLGFASDWEMTEFKLTADIPGLKPLKADDEF